MDGPIKSFDFGIVCGSLTHRNPEPTSPVAKSEEMTMANLVADGSPGRATADPQVREITVDDISYALTAGMRDFRAAPTFGLVFGVLFAAAGAILVKLMFDSGLIYLAYPVIAGFALIGPFAAIGLYEVSRRLEAGEPVTWSAVVGTIVHQGGRELGYMSLITMFGLIAWIYSAAFIYAIFFGLQSADIGDMITSMVTTPRGIVFLLVGNVVGGIMATVLFSISVLSYPLLMDRDVDFVTAMITSIRAVALSPAPLLGWGIFIATMLGIAILPMFLGLVLVLPLLGHASWHLYRRAVVAA
jgi:uncharacterized membrane protein